MLTKNEITALNLSPTKKDFVQIWNELLEVAGKLSERWDPTSTNESDPGIVLLKALTGIADKLNYNIDKNTLEAFMPTAAQEESMRKLCDMLGYNIKYYQSATTDVTLRYHNSDPSDLEKAAVAGTLEVPRFMVFTNVDQTVTYFNVTQDVRNINADSPSVTLKCMEGQVVKCESVNENNLITVNQITNDRRYYLPEVQIAENGIFIYNIITSETNGVLTSIEGPCWTKVDNLNTVVRGTLAYKFGFDSYEGRPYIEFPEDYSELFGSGLNIYYTRTSGANGNISPRTLTTMEIPNLDNWSDVAADSFTVENSTAANNGANPETIGQAYHNFKKTIGTFETLVTCRDYMNKIYSMMNDENKPYVSNVLVTDIRNDLNRSIIICTADEGGIYYKEKPRTTRYDVTRSYANGVNEGTRPVFHDGDTNKSSKWHLGTPTGMRLTKTSLIDGDNTDFDPLKGGDVFYDENTNRWCITQAVGEGTKTFTTVLQAAANVTFTEEVSTPDIDHFDLVLYPFKSYNQVRSNVKDIRTVYDSSFTYTEDNLKRITAQLESEQLSTIAHNFKKPRVNDVLCINNYLRLNALISTNTKLTVEESAFIVDKIKIDLANAFNMRALDFGEEIPFEDILSIIETADSRIRVVSLAEPALYTTFSVLDRYDANGKPVIIEYAVASSNWLPEEAAVATKRFRDKDKPYAFDQPLDYYDTAKAREIYNKLVLRNVLAGRVALFNYNDTFNGDFSECPYRVTEKLDDIPAGLETPTLNNPITLLAKGNEIYTGIYGEPNKYYKTYEPYNNLQEDAQWPIQELTTFCNISAPGGVAEDVELADGEYIKFRAPNFITEVTYPAYVNYHLHLNNAIDRTAIPAEGTSMFLMLNEDRVSFKYGTMENIMWAKVLRYFLTIDESRLGRAKAYPTYEKNNVNLSESERVQLINKRLVKRCSLRQKCSAFKAANANGVVQQENTSDDIIVELISQTETSGVEAKTPEGLLAESGCIFLSNTFDGTDETFVANLYWADPNQHGDVLANGKSIKIKLPEVNPYITNASYIEAIKQAVDDALHDRKFLPESDLPTAGDWIIEFNFESVPFDVATLPYWETFVQGGTVKLPSDSEYPDAIINSPVNFNIAKDVKSNAFWRLFSSGYSVGKYINDQGEKFLPVEANYVKNLPEERMKGVYILTNLGQDEQPEVILNNEEYQLQEGEKLYFEYTPSTQNADGTNATLPPVTKIYETGTIIRPSGFEPGLMDSEALKNTGKSYSKDNVSFKVNAGSGAEIVKLHSLGANEQIEIRDFARVVLENGTLENLYMYKNFDCEILESWDSNENGVRSYTLKDGEYIFYTDDSQSELAFFTNGTKVEIHGSVVIPKMDKIEIATILDAGVDSVPWKYIPLSDSGDKIIFQEYQYVTLGSGDRLGKVILTGRQSDIYAADEVPQITSEWTPCEKDATYYLSSDPTTEVTLPPVRLMGGIGGGWEICSVLELEASPSNSQTLRSTDKISTGLRMFNTAAGAVSHSLPTITPKQKENSTSSYPLTFKTNLNCQTNSTSVTMDEIYSNPKEYAGFQVKLYAKNQPCIVQTVRGKVLPYLAAGKEPANWDFVSWTGAKVPEKPGLELWSTIDMADLHSWDEPDEVPYDQALKLSANILPDTYGLMCIYVSYTSDEAAQKALTWFEVLPGAEDSIDNDITLLNYDGINKIAPSGYDPGNTAENGKLSTRMCLNPGLNCLRINKSCTFFIKSSIDAQGTVSFDDVRLVNKKVKAKDNVTKAYIANAYGLPANAQAGSEYIDTKYGLNLSQIQYLPVTTDRTLAEEVQEAIQAEVQKGFEAAEAQLELSANALVAEKLGKAKVTLAEIANKIRKIKGDNQATTIRNIITNIERELNLLVDADNRSTLAEVRTKLINSVENGQKLLTIMESATSTKQLVEQVTEAQKALYSALDTGVVAELLNAIANELRDLPDNANVESPLDFYVFLKKAVAAQKLPASVIVDLANIAKANDFAKRTERLQQIIEEIQTPAGHENYQQLISSLASLHTVLYKAPYEAIDVGEYMVNGDSIQQLRAVLLSIETQLQALGTKKIIEEGANAGEEIIEYPSGIAEKITTIHNLRASLESKSATAATASTVLSDQLIKDILDAVQTGVIHDIMQAESDLTELEATRVKGLLTEFVSSVNATTYYLADTAQVLTALKTLNNAVSTDYAKLLYDQINFSALQLSDTARRELVTYLPTASELTANAGNETVAAMILGFNSKLPSPVPTASEVKAIFAEATLHDLNQVLQEDTSTAAISAILNLTDVEWNVLKTSGLTPAFVDNIQTLAKSSKMIDEVNAPITSEIIAKIKSSVGSNTLLKTSLTALQNEFQANDPLRVLLAKLIAELSKTDPNNSNVTLPPDDAVLAMLTNKLRTLIQSENDLLGFIETRLAQAVTSATKEIGEINATSAIIATLKQEVIKANPQFQACLTTAFANEDAILDLITSVFNITDIFAQPAAVNEVITTFTTMLAQVDKDNPTVYAITGWPALQNAMTQYKDIADVLAAVQELRGTIEAQTEFTDLTSLLDALVEYRNEIINNTISNEANQLKRQLLPAILVLENAIKGIDVELATLPAVIEERVRIIHIEEQLMRDIKLLDEDHEFYYNIKLEDSLAIDFNESDDALNNMMNPATNYSINNVNNSFVISKLDIDHLTKGIQLARSSRLN